MSGFFAGLAVAALIDHEIPWLVSVFLVFLAAGLLGWVALYEG